MERLRFAHFLKLTHYPGVHGFTGSWGSQVHGFTGSQVRGFNPSTCKPENPRTSGQRYRPNRYNKTAARFVCAGNVRRSAVSFTV